MIAAATHRKTRLIRSHEPWNPHPYQERGILHLVHRHSAALFLDPGLGKTSVVLAAFKTLQALGQAKKMLVIAPLRVCQLVWEQEGRKWSQFRDLTFSLIHGRDKEAALNADVDIHLINPEGIAWLTQQFYGRSDLPWDVVTLDELTKFKNSQAMRSKKLRKKMHQIRYRWGLTGTPAPNGYMDLFGQFLMLDDGAALGRYITYYRDQYFRQGFTGFDYELKPGAAERIEEKIAPYVLRMSDSDYLDLPPVQDNIIMIDLPTKARRQYEDMKKEMLLDLPEGVVTAANSGAVYSKLKQMANGAVYVKDHDYAELHDAKLDALEDLIEELAGQPLLVAYEFQHDLHRLRARLGADIPTLSGLSHAKVTEVEAAWNRGEIPVLLAHPASAGHGLNLQGAGAGHVCWFSRPWDLELYDQFIRRIRRQGTTALRIMNHVLFVRDSMDEVVAEALDNKDTTQQRLLSALNAVLRDEPAPTPNREDDMAGVRKLGFQGAASAANSSAQKAAVAPVGAVRPKGWGPPADEDEGQQEEPQTAPQRPTRSAPAAESAAPVRPRGWGAPATAEEEEAGDDQRHAIRGKIASDPPADEEEEEEVPPSVRALSAFGPGIAQALTGKVVEDEGETPDDSTGDIPPKPEKPAKPARRRAAAPAAEQPQDAEGAWQGSAADTVAGLSALTGEKSNPFAQGVQERAAYDRVLGSSVADPAALATLFESIARLLRGS